MPASIAVMGAAIATRLIVVTVHFFTLGYSCRPVREITDTNLLDFDRFFFLNIHFFLLIIDARSRWPRLWINYPPRLCGHRRLAVGHSIFGYPLKGKVLMPRGRVLFPLVE